MKTEVLKYLQSKEGTPEDRYNAGMALLRKSEGKSIPAVNYYNRAGFTKENLKNICYDLQKLHGISDMEVLAKKKLEVRSEKLDKGTTVDTLNEVLNSVPNNVKAIVYVLATMPSGDYPAELLELWKPLNEFAEKHAKLFVEDDDTPMTTEDIFKTIYANVTDWEEVAEAIKELGSEIQAILEKNEINKTGTDIQKNDTDVAEKGTDVAKNDTISLKSELDKAPADAKAGLKLIEEFPFLDDADCPDSLKILVQDKFTAWRNYKAVHEALFVAVEVIDGETKETALTNAELYELATEALENFELNRAIWDELNYYKEHKEILGNHPIFADEKLKEKVARMKGTELVKRRNNVRSYITKETKKLKPDTEEEAAKKIKLKIKGYNQELQLLEARIEPEK